MCRFSVRDFVYNEAEFITGKKEIEDADIKAKKQFVGDLMSPDTMLSLL